MNEVIARPGASGEHRKSLRGTAPGGDIVARPRAWGERRPSMHWMVAGSDIVARRIGRIAFGSVLIAGFAALVVPACWDILEDMAGIHSPQMHATHAGRTIALTWLAAMLVGSIASRIAAMMSLSRAPEWLFVSSLTVPTFGIAVLSPLTLHGLVFLPFGMVGAHASEVFDVWVLASVGITGVAHLVFAGSCARRVSRLAAGQPARSPRSVVAITVGTSCVPFVLLLGIPPGLVAITGLLLLPVLRVIDRLVERERRELAGATLPRAIVRP